MKEHHSSVCSTLMQYVYIRLHALGFDLPPPSYNSLSTLIQHRHWTRYRSDIHICYTHELDRCVSRRRRETEKGLGINIACLYFSLGAHLMFPLL